MLDDKQSAKSIAALLSGSGSSITEDEILALAKPKPAHSAFNMFGQDQRDAVAAEIGTRAFTEVTTALGERWKEQKDTSKWVEMADRDQERYQKEVAIYQEGLEEEEKYDRRLEESRKSAQGPVLDPQKIKEMLW